MINAILMAAGRGTRISRQINSNCKCTLDVGGIPLIKHTVQMLMRHGIKPHVVVGYNKKHIIESLVGLDVVFHENIFYSITNSVVSLWFAREALQGGAVILGNADVYWEENLLSILLEEKRDCVMLSDSSRVEQGDYLFRVEDGMITAYGKGTVCQHANCEYVGLSMIQGDMIRQCKSHLEHMVENQRHDCWWEQVLYDMAHQRPIWSRDVSGHFWAEIDYIEDYERVLEYRRSKGL